ncbi:MAG: hypothetical protein ACQET8_18715 [Bacillota bacterium]|uniref:hypothetical protein n=1 Tax=Fictibacillus sp. 18YEL24 TaxID=2745875 RepID=UPI0018CE7BE1|nr:hypothetical protein [Fictibacillus sp. 18YEL24]MBH0171257.1 hypothetical protein [Fictibacillus sp. 18YEL24]
MDLHPITVIEIMFTLTLISTLFIIAFLIPKTKRKTGLYTASVITSLVLLFFIIRPFWIDYHVSVKKDQLTLYLEKQFPNEKWQITQNIGWQYNPYIFLVEFHNEKGWKYHYFVKNADHIKQHGLSMPDDSKKIEGKHKRNDW